MIFGAETVSLWRLSLARNREGTSAFHGKIVASNCVGRPEAASRACRAGPVVVDSGVRDIPWKSPNM